MRYARPLIAGSGVALCLLMPRERHSESKAGPVSMAQPTGG